MVDPIGANRRNWDERATIHARDTTGEYMLDRFRSGEDALHAMLSKPPNSAIFPESASFTYNATSGATRFASCDTARWRPDSISLASRSTLRGAFLARLG